jgi:hypothetical protein
MMQVPQSDPLRRWFAGLVEDCFQQEVGLADVRVLDYLTELLTTFIDMRRIQVADEVDGRAIEDLAGMLCAAELGSGASDLERRRAYHRHIGDYTLFWTGVYPENLRRRHRHESRDRLLDYSAQGKRSYGIASELSDASTTPEARVLHVLSENFDYCIYGLGLVRRSWERGGGTGNAGPIWPPKG